MGNYHASSNFNHDHQILIIFQSNFNHDQKNFLITQKIQIKKLLIIKLKMTFLFGENDYNLVKA